MSLDPTSPHLALAHEGPIDATFLEEFRTSVSARGLDLRVEQRISTCAMASLELVLGTAVVVWVFKAYFTGFLEESGRLHAQALKGAIKTLGKRLRDLRYVRITARGPIDPRDRFSPIYSVWTERDADSRFKMLVNSDFTEAGLEVALDAYLTFIETYHTGCLEPEDMDILAAALPVGGVVLLAYDESTASIKLVDPLFERLG